MLKSKILWAFILGVVTSALLLEAKIHLGYSPWETRILGALAAPGTHLVTAINQPGTLFQGWTKFWMALSFACNLLVYIFFWYACIWLAATARSRKQPYERENTLVPPTFR